MDLAVRGGAIRIQNSILGDFGSLQRSNLGAGRVVDLRSIGVDTLEMYNNVIYNVIDRVIRYLGSPKPVFSLKFNHNTVMDCISYHGFMSLGWIDSAGNGPFEIKDNLFRDNYALGPDTDWTRQGEMSDNPDKDINTLGKCAWIIARQNTTGHVTPWDISNNYYYVSDSGKAIRDYETGVGLHHVYYGSSAAEPIMTSDIIRQVDANGGNSATAFTKTNIRFALAPPCPDRMGKFYFDPYALGYVPTTIGGLDSCKGAGAGKLKDATAPTDNFARLPQFVAYYNQFDRYPYDIKRMRIDSVMDWLDCGFESGVDLSAASSDGKIVGSTMYTWNGLWVSVGKTDLEIPQKFTLNQNYPNPFNPNTKIEYTLPTAVKVSLKIFNLLGQVVATLVDEKQEANTYVKEFDASMLSSGIYFYQLQAGNFNATKKMVLMK
jgi:hypothetical protein